MSHTTRYPRGLGPSTRLHRSARNRRGSFWPNAQEELLLRAAILDGEEAIDALEKWQGSVDIEHISYGSFRLLPLLYRNAERMGSTLRHEDIVADVYRRSWGVNAILLDRAGRALEGLAAENIDTMLLKGAALTLKYYGDRGVRPLGDVDILVRRVDAPKAFEVLKDLGWQHPKTQLFLDSGWAASMRHPNGGAVDLHWNPRADFVTPTAARPFWETAGEAELGGVNTAVQGPADLLLHVVCHGLAAGGGIRWVADALKVMQEVPDLDWGRFIDQTKEQHVTLRALTGLTYLADGFDAEIPETALDGERAGRLWERLEQWSYERWKPESETWPLVRKWFQYQRRCAVENRPAHPWGFISHLAEITNRSKGAVVRAAMRKVARRPPPHEEMARTAESR